jgi:tRNA pseudouridine38-40 synthase
MPGEEAQGSYWKLVLSYDGSDFSGSQRQTNGRTIQEELETVLARLAGKPVVAQFAGRTDRGVHATGQVVGIGPFRNDLPPARLQLALNQQLPASISVIAVSEADCGFHPRYDAVWREYRYRIWLGAKSPLVERYAWQYRGPFDLARAQDAASRFEGEHDLASFAGLGHGVPWAERQERSRGTVRNVMRCSVRVVPAWWGAAPDTGSGVEIRIVADGFLPNMVRTIVATLAEIASGRQSPTWVDTLLEARDRRVGPKTAPPHGLILWRIGYGNDLPATDPDTIGSNG